MTQRRIRELSYAFAVCAVIITGGFIAGDLLGRASAHGMVFGSICALMVAPWSMVAVARR